LKRVIQLAHAVITMSIMFIFTGCINYWYPPANALPTRPVYVYGKTYEPTIVAGFKKTIGQNEGEVAQLGMAGFRIGDRFKIFQSFVGLNAYRGFYKVGAIDSSFINKSVKGAAIEWEGNIVIPVDNVNFGAGIYARGNSEGGDYYHFRKHYQDQPDLDGDADPDVDAAYSNYGDLHFILNINGKLDYTFILSQCFFNTSDVNSPVYGFGISAKRIGGWVTIAPYHSKVSRSYQIDTGITYRIGNDRYKK
jgi:hypothetical protein